MQNKNKAYLLALNAYGNQDLCPDCRINKHIPDNILPSQAAADCIKNSLENAGLQFSDIDFLISASSTPDFNNPGLSQSVLGKFEGVNIGAMEIRQSAAGFHYALELAANFVESGIYNSVLIVCTEFLARAFYSMKETHKIDAELKNAFDICADGVASCIVCNSQSLPGVRESTARFLIKERKIISNQDGAETFGTSVPSSSQFPRRITREDVINNLHLARIDKKNFVQKSKNSLINLIAEIPVSGCKHLILTAPLKDYLAEAGLSLVLNSSQGVIETSNDYAYRGSASQLIAVSDLLKESQFTAGDLLHTISLGAGINMGAARLEFIA